MDATAFEGGFENAPIDAAHAFRACLEALARPGQIETLAGATPPAPLSPAAGTLVLTLCDPETPIHLAGATDTQDVRAWIMAQTNAPLVPAEEAAFAIGPWAALQPIDRFAIGEADYPDRSATLIVEMEALSSEGARLTGPGIEHEHHLSVPETAAFQGNRLLYPLGLDFFLTCGDRVAGLPRTTRVEAL